MNLVDVAFPLTSPDCIHSRQERLAICGRTELTCRIFQYLTNRQTLFFKLNAGSEYRGVLLGDLFAVQNLRYLSFQGCSLSADNDRMVIKGTVLQITTQYEN